MKKLLLFCLAFAAFACGATGAFASDYTLIGHPCGPATLSKADVKNILLGNKTKWDGGGLIKLAVLTSGSAHEAVVREFTSRSTDQFDKFWKKQVFTGKCVAPDTFPSDEDMIAFVAKTPGAFGYISSGSTPAGVTVISVQ